MHAHMNIHAHGCPRVHTFAVFGSSPGLVCSCAGDLPQGRSLQATISGNHRMGREELMLPQRTWNWGPDSGHCGLAGRENLPLVFVQSLSCIWLFAPPQTAAHQASLFFIISQSLLKLLSVELMMPSNHLILCCPLLLLPSIFSCIRVFSNELALHNRWSKYWSFSISPSRNNAEYSRLNWIFKVQWVFKVDFSRIDCTDFLAVQGILKSLLQHHNLQASILWYSVFFMVQLTSVHDSWKNDNFDSMNLCRQSDVSAFQYHV